MIREKIDRLLLSGRLTLIRNTSDKAARVSISMAVPFTQPVPRTYNSVPLVL